jgi:hypothetical protein
MESPGDLIFSMHGQAGGLLRKQLLNQLPEHLQVRRKQSPIDRRTSGS